MSKQVFISHSSKDRDVAAAICTALENRGLPCWLASRNVGPGENYQEAIVKAIRAAKIMVLVFTENANNSDEIKKELSLASQNNLVIIPVRIENVAPNEALAYEFATRQWVDLFRDWEHEIERLSSWIAGIQSIEPEVTAPKATQAVAHDVARFAVKPSSALSKNPLHHFVGAFLLIVGAFLAVLCISIVFDHKFGSRLVGTTQAWDAATLLLKDCPDPDLLPSNLKGQCEPINWVGAASLLVIFSALIATGLGTFRKQTWARVLGLGLCAVGLLVSGYLILVNAVTAHKWFGASPFDPYRIGSSGHFGSVLVASAVLSGVFVIAFLWAAAIYVWLWHSSKLDDTRRTNTIHVLRSINVFVIFTLFFAALTVASVYLYQDSYLDPTGNPVLWSFILIAVDAAVLAYCYAQFRSVFRVPINSKSQPRT
jgi:hypothetical protein